MHATTITTESVGVSSKETPTSKQSDPSWLHGPLLYLSVGAGCPPTACKRPGATEAQASNLHSEALNCNPIALKEPRLSGGVRPMKDYYRLLAAVSRGKDGDQVAHSDEANGASHGGTTQWRGKTG